MLRVPAVPRWMLASLAGCWLLLGSAGAELRQAEPERWVTAWGTSQQALGTTTITDASVRMIARVTIAGEAVRLRIDNTFGMRPLVIDSVYVGERMRGAALLPGSNRPVFFDGLATVTIPPGGSVQSDPVQMRVLARQDLAVSLYLPDAEVRPSQHTRAGVTSYLSANGSGDVTGIEAAEPFAETTTSMFWLKALDVLTSASTGVIVAFGDSITDGSCATLDAHDRWEDWLAVRLALDADARDGGHKAVVNEGIGGNTVTRQTLQPPPNSPTGIERLERDVLSHHGVTHVMLFMGTNDIRREASAEHLIEGMQTIIQRVQARGLKIIGVTIIPRHNRPPTDTNTGWNPHKTQVRNQVNEWIRTRAPFDEVVDFDRVVRDPADPDLINPPFNCDDIHPTPRGYYEMGRAVPLDLFASAVTETHPAGQRAAMPRTSWGAPDLQGIWNHGTITPLERPRQFGEREFLTDAEVAELNAEAAARGDRRDRSDPERDVRAAYNAVWWDRGVSVGRTSLIVDPPDGRLPAMTREAQQRAASPEVVRLRAVRAGRLPANGPEDMDLGDRCLVYRPVPVTSSGYNNHVQIAQTPDHVAIFQEQIHEVRIIPLDERPHIPGQIRQWLGDSRGWWEGPTLVVETTNFSEKTGYRGSSEHRHVIERFTRVADDTLEYTFTVSDPTTWTRAWTGMVPWRKTEGPIYEYACHEGNYGMFNLLAGSRAQERAQQGAVEVSR